MGETAAPQTASTRSNEHAPPRLAGRGFSAVVHMKRVRVRATPDPGAAPRAFELLADSDDIRETRLLELNLGGEVGPTMLFAVEGNHAGLAEELVDEAPIERVDVTPIAAERAVVLATVRPGKTPMTAAIFEAFTRSGLIIETPVVYRHGTVSATLIGPSSVVQSVLEAFPREIAVDVEAIAEFGDDAPMATLSDRQREALLAGYELGYYAVPREATHREVADRLGCAPSTASEHLQKAEAKLVRSLLESDDP